MRTDAELLAEFVAHRSERAFTEIVARHLNLVHGTALRLLGNDAHLASDVTQTVFVLLAKKAPTLPVQVVLAGWLHTATRHTVANTRRAEQRRQAREQEAFRMNHDLTETAIEWERVRPVLDAAIARLGNADRDAILLRYFEARPFAEIAAALCVSEDAARMRVERALEKLRGLLGQHGINSTTAALTAVFAQQLVGAAPMGMVSSVAGAALANAARSGTNVLSWLTAPKFASAVAGVVLLMLCFLAVRETHRRLAAEEAQSEEMDNVAQLTASLGRARQRTRSVDIATARLRTVADTLRREQMAATPTTFEPVAMGKLFAEAHPEAVRLIASYGRSVMMLRYQEMFRRLGLTPAQIEQFCDIAYQHDAGIEWMTAGRAPFLQLEVGDMSRQQIDTTVRTALGEEVFAAYTGLTSELRSGVRRVAEQMIKADYYSDSPLSPAQAARLTAVVIQNTPGYREGRNQGLTQLAWDNVIADARTFLSEPQVARLALVREQYEVRQAIGRAANAAMQEAKTAAGIPAGP